MKTLQESIIGRKGTKSKFLRIPGKITLRYEADDGNWDGKDYCDGWYVFTNPEEHILLLWSPKAKYSPYFYYDTISSWNQIVNWDLLEGVPDIKTPEDMYDIITDVDKWNEVVVYATIFNVYIDMPDNVIRDIRRYTGL